MKIETREDLERAIGSIRYADETFERLELAQRCVEKSLFFKDKQLEFEARSAHLRMLIFLSQTEEAIALFPWFLNYMDKEGENMGGFDRFSVLWSYKWILGSIPEYSKIPMQKAEALMADFERRVQDERGAARLIAYEKMRYYSDMGDQEKGMKYFEEYFNNPTQGRLEDCQACQPNNYVEVFQRLDQDESALQHLAPILAGDLRCHTVPHTSYPKALWSVMKLGQWDKATEYATQAENHLDLEKPWGGSWGPLFYFYAYQKKFVQGRKIIEKQLPYTFGRQNDLQKVELYFSIAIFLEALRQDGQEQITLKFGTVKLPDGFPQPDQQAQFEVMALKDWFRKESIQAAVDLDKRNGNTYWSTQIATRQAWAQELGMVYGK